MAVKIRFARIGKKHVPFYRIVVVDSRKKRDGQALDIVGTYDAIKSTIVTYDTAKAEAWIAKGAQMSDAVKKVHKLSKAQA